MSPTREYMRARYLAIKNGTWRPKHGPQVTPKALVHPGIAEINWAAGFLEGEGYFLAQRDHRGVVGLLAQHSGASQANREPLLRLQSLFGGNIRSKPIHLYHLGKKPLFEWRVSGARARGIMMTLFPLLSQERRSQVRRALGII